MEQIVGPGPRARLRSRRTAGVVALVVVLLGLVPAAWARGPGAGDDGFGDAGFTFVDSEVGIDEAYGMTETPDGRTLVLSTSRRADDEDYQHQTTFLTRLLADGRPDPTFGDGGRRELPDTLIAPWQPFDMVVGADGMITLAITAYRYVLESPGYRSDVYVYRLHPDGSPDAEWADDPLGRRRLEHDGSGQPYEPYLHTLELGADGTPFFQILSSAGDTPLTRTEQYRVLPTIEPDPSFGGGDGEMVTDHGIGLRRDRKGRWLGAYTDETYFPDTYTRKDELVVTRRLADGSFDPSFGAGGTFRIEDPTHLRWSTPLIAFAGTDVIVVDGRYSMRFDEHGVPRPEWGDGETLDLERWHGADLQLLEVDGRLVTVGKVHDDPCLISYRLDERGDLDPAWGDGGTLHLCPRGGRGQDELADAVEAGGGIRVLSTSTAVSNKDDAATVTTWDRLGRPVLPYGTGGASLLRYGNEGVDKATAVVALPGGRSRIAMNTPDGPAVAQLDAAGQLDPAWGDGGIATSTIGPANAGQLIVLADGRTIVAGDGLLAFTPTGQVATSFGGDGAVEGGGAYGITQLLDGRIVVAEPTRIVAYRLDGSVDTAFGTGGVISDTHMEFSGVIRRGAGFVVAAERLYEGRIAAFTALGQPDPTFAGGRWVDAPASSEPYHEPTSLAVTGDGKVYVASGTALAGFRADGSRTGLTAPPYERPWGGTRGIAIDSVGRIIVGRVGHRDAPNLRLERLLPSGTRDTTFGDDGVLRLDPSPSGYVELAGLDLDANDRLFLAISDGGFADDGDAGIARFDTRIPAELPTLTIGAPVIIEEGDPDPSTEYDDGTYISVPFHLDRPSSVVIFFEVVVTDGTAQEGRDYDAGPLGSFVYSGSTEGSFALRTLGDLDLEGDETFTIDLVGADQAIIGDRTRTTVTITDDDVPELPARTTQVIAGPDRIGTSIAISQERYGGGLPGADQEWREDANTVVLARADSFADALAGTPLAAQLHAPILLTGRDSLDPRVLEEVRRLLGQGTNHVHVLGGTGAIGDEVVQQLYRAGYSVRRHAGVDRFATAAAIADLVNASEVLLVTGRSFPDGLAAGAAAARRTGVVLLTDDAVMPTATAAWLADHPTLPVIAIGGPAGRARPSARLISGPDRYATALAVAQQLFPGSLPVAGLASGEGFADALAGGAHTANRGGPLLLTRRGALPPGVATYVDDRVTTTLYVYGGPSAISPTALTAVA